jgi:hypothetical protein
LYLYPFIRYPISIRISIEYLICIHIWKIIMNIDIIRLLFIHIRFVLHPCIQYSSWQGRNQGRCQPALGHPFGSLEKKRSYGKKYIFFWPEHSIYLNHAHSIYRSFLISHLLRGINWYFIFSCNINQLLLPITFFLHSLIMFVWLPLFSLF